MSAGSYDLVVLVADKNMEHAVKGILARHQSLDLRPIRYQMFVHPHRDPGCRQWAAGFLRVQLRRFDHALVLFDREGCGQEDKSREELEREGEDALGREGWGERAAVVVLDPELEAWVWSDSPKVDEHLGWQGHEPDLRSWLRARSQLGDGETKPSRPKEAMEQALREVGQRRTSARYQDLAQSVSLQRCSDAAFQKLGTTLQRWFAAQST